ncbi:MAG: hypothetical protein GY866_09615 [Proteobacteria bacterium]|nr:hypothetical protein [Pseudomonadota bacterium]
MNHPDLFPCFNETIYILLREGHTQKYAATAWTSLFWHEDVHPEYRTFVNSLVARIIQGHLEADLPDYHHEESGKTFSAYAYTLGEMFIQMMRLNSDLYSILTEIFVSIVRTEMSGDPEKGKDEEKKRPIRGEEKETDYVKPKKLFDDIIDYISERGKLPLDNLGQSNPNEYMLILADRMRITRKYVVQNIMDLNAQAKKKSSKHTPNQDNLDSQDPPADQQVKSSITTSKDIPKDFAYRLAAEIASVKVRELDWEIVSGRIAALLFQNMNRPETLPYFIWTIDVLLAEEHTQYHAVIIWSSFIRQEDIHPEYRTFIESVVKRMIQGHLEGDLPNYQHEESGRKFSAYAHTLGEMFIQMMRLNSSLYGVLTEIFELIIQTEMSRDQ